MTCQSPTRVVCREAVAVDRASSPALDPVSEHAATIANEAMNIDDSMSKPFELPLSPRIGYSAQEIEGESHAQVAYRTGLGSGRR